MLCCSGWFVRGSLLLVLSAILFLSCGSGVNAQRENAIKSAQKAVLANPGNTNAVRELGILYYEAGEFQKSRALLQKVLTNTSDDLRCRSYLGLTYEALNMTDKALDLYTAPVLQSSPYGNWLLGRQKILKRQQAHGILRSRIEEVKIEETSLSNQSIVVAPVTYHGKKSKYESLSTGITALFTHALGKLNAVTVADHFEVELTSSIIQAQSDSDLREKPLSIMGEVFSSATLVKCNYNIVDDRQIVLDVAYWNLNKEGLPTAKTYLAPLDGGLAVIRQDVVADLRTFIAHSEGEPFFQARIDKDAFTYFCSGIINNLDSNFEKSQNAFDKALENNPQFELCAFFRDQNQLMLDASKTPRELGLLPEAASASLNGIQDHTFNLRQ